jgi:hypothetical protein
MNVDMLTQYVGIISICMCANACVFMQMADGVVPGSARNVPSGMHGGKEAFYASSCPLGAP